MPPRLFAATDAINFDRNGTISVLFSDEYGLYDPITQGPAGVTTVTATLTITGTLQPIVPEPGAICIAGIALLTAIMLRKRRS